MVLSLTSNLYTLVLALIYIALGALLFIKRKVRQQEKQLMERFCQ